jgi:pyrroline-5-carboxylate reductase
LEFIVFKNKKIAFIGSGVMAEAMISGLIRENIIPKESIFTSDPRKKRIDELSARYGVNTDLRNQSSACQGDVVVLSIKPQALNSVLPEIRDCLQDNVLILSIVAGAPIAKISKGLDRKMVVRSMPNTPAQIGQGITVWTASNDVTNEQREMAKTILSAFGEEVFIGEEYFLDMATALSGTGPAYVFLFMEAMVDAGVHLGFPRHIAERLVTQTVRGSVNYFDMRDAPVHLARLRNQVTSAGGTTAAALYYLEKAGFRTAISRAIWAAYERSCELGKDAKPHSPKGE